MLSTGSCNVNFIYMCLCVPVVLYLMLLWLPQLIPPMLIINVTNSWLVKRVIKCLLYLFLGVRDDSGQKKSVVTRGSGSETTWSLGDWNSGHMKCHISKEHSYVANLLDDKNGRPMPYLIDSVALQVRSGGSKDVSRWWDAGHPISIIKLNGTTQCFGSIT